MQQNQSKQQPGGILVPCQQLVGEILIGAHQCGQRHPEQMGRLAQRIVERPAQHRQGEQQGVQGDVDQRRGGAGEP